MKNCLIVFAAGLMGLAFTAGAAQQLVSSDVGQLRASGTVSASGAANLSDLEDKLAEKAHQQGAKGFIINSAGGDNHMYGTATLYK